MNFLEKEIKYLTETLEYAGKNLSRAASLMSWFTETEERRNFLNDPRISGLNLYTSSMILVLDNKQDHSHFAVDMAKVFGKPVTKSPSYDGQSILLTVKDLKISDITEISTWGYKPSTCKLEEYRVPVTEERKKQLEDELTLGSVKFKMNCAPEPEDEVEPADGRIMLTPAAGFTAFPEGVSF